MDLFTAKIDRETHTLHNIYRLERFFARRGPGELRNPYGQRMMMVSEDFIVGFQVALEEEIGDAAGDIMYRCGYEWGKADIAAFAERYAKEFGRRIDEANFGSMLETWWWPLQAAGWGSWRYDLSHRKEGLIYVDLFESAVARSVGNIGKVACHYYAGLFAAVFSHLAKRELSGIEIQCYSMGEEFCKFVVGSSKRINAAQFWVQEGARADEVIARL
ncbi:MAG: 4-vinyl reductase [Myxococcales bacterium]|nr:4-vinyl reductase [Myxococcales bacterium]